MKDVDENYDTNLGNYENGGGRRRGGGGTEDSCKGQTVSLPCRVMETQPKVTRDREFTQKLTAAEAARVLADL